MMQPQNQTNACALAENKNRTQVNIDVDPSTWNRVRACFLCFALAVTQHSKVSTGLQKLCADVYTCMSLSD
jgi:hypothetical protein